MVHAVVGARVGGEQVHGIPRVADVRGDGRGRGDAPLQRAAAARARVTDRAGVEHDHGTPLRRAVLLTHHELAGAGGGGPVDAAQVVAVAVLAHGLVVLAVQGHHVRDRPLRPHAAAERAARGEGHDLRQDDDLGVAAHGGGAQGEAERVADAHAERADAVHPAGVRAHGVLHLLHVTGAERGQHEPWAVAQGVVDGLLGHDDRRGCRLDVADAHGDHRSLVDGDAGRRGGAHDVEVQAVPPHQHEGDDGEGQQQDAHPGHVVLAEQDAGGDEHDPAAGERRAAGRE